MKLIVQVIGRFIGIVGIVVFGYGIFMLFGKALLVMIAGIILFLAGAFIESNNKRRTP